MSKRFPTVVSAAAHEPDIEGACILGEGNQKERRVLQVHLVDKVVGDATVEGDAE